MPKNFVNGGWGFSAIAMILSYFLTIFCAKLLLDTRAALGGRLSFSEIGEKTWGKPGKIMVDITLVASQVSFVTAYVYFIASNMQSIIQHATVKDDGTLPEPVSKWYFGLLCLCIYVPLCMVRKVEKLAKTHLFGDVMILFTILVIFVYASVEASKNGFKPEGIPFIRWKLFPDAIGFAVYAYEGIGVILPIQDITADKENYFKILSMTVGFIAILCIVFSEFTIFAYGTGPVSENPHAIQTLITDSLPQQQVFIWIVEILFCLNLVFSYPLVIFPANIVIESYLYAGWPKSKKRQWCKNLNRSLMVIFSIIVALIVYD